MCQIIAKGTVLLLQSHQSTYSTPLTEKGTHDTKSVWHLLYVGFWQRWRWEGEVEGHLSCFLSNGFVVTTIKQDVGCQLWEGSRMKKCAHVDTASDVRAEAGGSPLKKRKLVFMFLLFNATLMWGLNRHICSWGVNWTFKLTCSSDVMIRNRNKVSLIKTSFCWNTCDFIFK